MGPLQTDLAVPPAPAGPVMERQRILALDLLRGFAVLGILVMNVQGFAEISVTRIRPLTHIAWRARTTGCGSSAICWPMKK